MGGNREQVTLPCAFVARLLWLALWRIDPDKEEEMARLDAQAEELLKGSIKITTGNEEESK
jgi:hypothetical protein